MICDYKLTAADRGIVPDTGADMADAVTAMLSSGPEWGAPRPLSVSYHDVYDAEALCSVRIPDECLAWKSIGVWISPLEKMKLHDWVAEKGAPGLLSHLWVTKS